MYLIDHFPGKFSLKCNKAKRTAVLCVFAMVSEISHDSAELYMLVVLVLCSLKEPGYS